MRQPYTAPTLILPRPASGLHTSPRQSSHHKPIHQRHGPTDTRAHTAPTNQSTNDTVPQIPHPYCPTNAQPPTRRRPRRRCRRIAKRCHTSTLTPSRPPPVSYLRNWASRAPGRPRTESDRTGSSQIRLGQDMHTIQPARQTGHNLTDQVQDQTGSDQTGSDQARPLTQHSPRPAGRSPQIFPRNLTAD